MMLIQNPLISKCSTSAKRHRYTYTFAPTVQFSHTHTHVYSQNHDHDRNTQLVPQRMRTYTRAHEHTRSLKKTQHKTLFVFIQHINSTRLATSSNENLTLVRFFLFFFQSLFNQDFLASLGIILTQSNAITTIMTVCQRQSLS